MHPSPSALLLPWRWRRGFGRPSLRCCAHQRPQVAQQRGDRAPALDLGRAKVAVLAGILVALGGTRREPAMGAAAPVRHGRLLARRALPGARPAARFCLRCEARRVVSHNFLRATPDAPGGLFRKFLFGRGAEAGGLFRNIFCRAPAGGLFRKFFRRPPGLSFSRVVRRAAIERVQRAHEAVHEPVSGGRVAAVDAWMGNRAGAPVAPHGGAMDRGKLRRDLLVQLVPRRTADRPVDGSPKLPVHVQLLLRNKAFICFTGAGATHG
jgi:hypothetical protein